MVTVLQLIFYYCGIEKKNQQFKAKFMIFTIIDSFPR